MFKTIFLHELDFWKRNPLPYIFGAFLFVLCFVSMWGMASEEVSGPKLVVQNSESRLNYLIGFINQLLLFMLPAIIGSSIYRDYKSRIYSFLYSYPFGKIEYLAAKFASSFLVLLLVASMIGAGFYLGALMPSVNADAISGGGFRYLKLYLLFVIPNLFIVSAFIFCLVAQSRNIYIGFVSTIVLVIGISVCGSFSNYFVYLADPMGSAAVRSLTKYWTLSERNSNTIPLEGILLANRFIWLGLASVFLAFFFRRFDLSQFGVRRQRKQAAEEESSTPILPLKKNARPEVNYATDLKSRLLCIWRLSNADFRSAVLSWPFFTLLLAGFVMVYIQQKGMAPQYDVPILPTTAEMLRIPMFIFSGIFNLITFLYAGILIYRGSTTRMDPLIDTTPQSNFVLLSTRLLAILKVQFVLLSMIFIGGLLAQVMQGYIRFEFWHYALELYVVNYLHFAIWAAVAMFIHSFFNNMYVSFLVLLLLPIVFLTMPSAAEILNLPFLAESILHFNLVPGLYIGFDYSDFNGYGTVLPVYFFYKLYWLLGACLALTLALLFWKRGLTFSLKDRLQVAKSRFTGTHNTTKNTM